VPFETSDDRDEHFDKHKREFDAGLTAIEYESRADAFMSAKPVFYMTECVHVYGGRARLNLVTNEYALVDSRGFLVTYFIANPAIHGYQSNLEYHRSWCR
jgi:hypothetical protein